MKNKAISLFAGAGGCSLGFKKAGFDIIAAYDNNQAAVNTYNKNFSEEKCKLTDLSSCDFEQMRTDLGLKKGELDLIIGGPPCQGFSSAGTRFWDDPRNQLLKNYGMALKEFQPKWFFMENVEGLLTTGSGKYVYEAIKMFTDLGYTIALEKVYSQEYGVPQRRKRVIVIGNREGKDFSFPKSENLITGSIFRNSSNTLRKAIQDLENIESIEIDHIPKKEEGINYERYRNLKPGQTMKDLPMELRHKSFQKRASRRVMDGTPTEKRGGAPSGLKRLIYDEPSLTITSAATREFIHPVENRTLTIRECARIQTFPDDFVFIGSNSEKIKQIGNAIPPKLAEVFANHILNIAQNHQLSTGVGLIYYKLTKASAMSPTLKKTDQLLSSLCQNSIFEEGDLLSESYQAT